MKKYIFFVFLVFAIFGGVHFASAEMVIFPYTGGPYGLTYGTAGYSGVGASSTFSFSSFPIYMVASCSVPSGDIAHGNRTGGYDDIYATALGSIGSGVYEYEITSMSNNASPYWGWDALWNSSLGEWLSGSGVCGDNLAVSTSYIPSNPFVAPSPSPTLLFPDDVSDIANFSYWVVSGSNLSSSSINSVGVLYGLTTSTMTYNDSLLINSSFDVPSTSWRIYKTGFSSTFASSTLIYAQPYLIESVGSSTAYDLGSISSFTLDNNVWVNNTTHMMLSGYTTTASTSTLDMASPFYVGVYTGVSVMPTSSYQIATSTCTGFLDITCELGNFFNIAWNGVFGINTNELYNLTGFLTTRNSDGSISYNTPWATSVGQIISAVQSTSSTLPNSSDTVQWSFALGSHTVSTTVFAVSMAQEFMPDGWASLIKGFGYFAMVSGLLILWVFEIMSIFGNKDI